MTIRVDPKAIAAVKDEMIQAIKDVDGYLDTLEGVVIAQINHGWEGAAKNQFFISRGNWEKLLADMMIKLGGNAQALEDAATGLMATDANNATYFPGA